MNALVLNKLAASDNVIRQQFGGVYALNNLPANRRHYRSFIVNTDPAHKKGRHWQALYFRKDGICIFFCSYGTLPAEPIRTFALNNARRLIWNRDRLQHPLTQTCGLFCIYFLYHISRGTPINSLKHLRLCENERIIQRFAHRHLKLIKFPYFTLTNQKCIPLYKYD